MEAESKSGKPSFDEIWPVATRIYEKIKGSPPPSIQEDPFALELKTFKIGSKSCWRWAEEIIQGLAREEDVMHFVVQRTAQGKILEADSLLSPREASKLLHVNYRTLWRWAVKENRIRFVRLPSGHLRYYKEDLEKILSGTKTSLLGSMDS